MLLVHPECSRLPASCKEGRYAGRAAARNDKRSAVPARAPRSADAGAPARCSPGCPRSAQCRRGFRMAMPVPDLRERVDAATAEHIANQIPAGGAAREAMLCELLEPVVAGAIASCREAHDAWAGAAAAEETQRRTQRAGYFRIESLQERAAALTWRAADLMMIA